MNLRRLTIDNNIYVSIAAFVGIALVNAAFAKTHWRVWIHWTWSNILEHFVGVVVATFFVLALSYGLGEHLMKNKNGVRVERRSLRALCRFGFSVLSDVW